MTIWDPGTLDEARVSVLGHNGDYNQLTAEHVSTIIENLDPAHLSPLPDGPILDFGCGIGRLTIPISEQAPHRKLVGVDQSLRMLAFAAEAAPSLEWRVTLPDDPGRFAAVYSMLTFQHLPDEECARLVYAFARLLKPGGRVCVQWTVGSNRGDWCWERDEDTVRAWFADAGLMLRLWMPDETGRFPTWRWTTGEKL